MDTAWSVLCDIVREAILFRLKLIHGFGSYDPHAQVVLLFISTRYGQTQSALSLRPDAIRTLATARRNPHPRAIVRVHGVESCLLGTGGCSRVASTPQAGNPSCHLIPAWPTTP